MIRNNFLTQINMINMKLVTKTILFILFQDSGNESSPIRLKDFKGQNHKGASVQEKDNLVT